MALALQKQTSQCVLLRKTFFPTLCALSGAVRWEVAPAQAPGEAADGHRLPGRSGDRPGAAGTGTTHLHQREDATGQESPIRQQRAGELENIKHRDLCFIPPSMAADTKYCPRPPSVFPVVPTTVQVELQKLRLYCDPHQSERETACEIYSVVRLALCTHTAHTHCRDKMHSLFFSSPCLLSTMKG